MLQVLFEKFENFTHQFRYSLKVVAIRRTAPYRSGSASGIKPGRSQHSLCACAVFVRALSSLVELLKIIAVSSVNCIENYIVFFSILLVSW